MRLSPFLKLPPPAVRSLSSLLKTLEIVDTDEYTPLQLVADFGTLVGTYARGFAVITEPYDERLPQVRTPRNQVIAFCCGATAV